MLVNVKLSNDTHTYRPALLQKLRLVLNVKLALPRNDTISATHAPMVFAR